MNNKYYFTKETYILSSLIDDKILVKNADADFTDIISNTVKSVVPEDAKKETTIEGILGFLTPGVVALVLKAIGGPWLALFGGAIASAFDFNLGSLISSITRSLSSKSDLSPDDVSQVINTEVNSHLGNPNRSQIENAARADKLIRSTYLNYQEELFKQGYTITRLKKIASGDRSKFVSVLTFVLGVIIKVFLISCGFSFAKGLIKKVVGPSESDQSDIQVHKSTQRLFKMSPSYNVEIHRPPWYLNVPPSEISNTLLDWAVEVYPSTSNYLSVIRNVQSFIDIVDDIKNYNAQHNLNVTYIPKAFYTKAMVVDQFIDDAAAKVTQMLKSQ